MPTKKAITIIAAIAAISIIPIIIIFAQNSQRVLLPIVARSSTSFATTASTTTGIASTTPQATPSITITMLTTPTVTQTTMSPTATPTATLPVTPTPTPTIIVIPIVIPPEDDVSARLTVPAGFHVRGFAAHLLGPRLMTVGPDGAIYVAERDAGRVSRLADDDHNGLADRNEIVLTGLNGPHNMEWFNGCLYVAENDQISRHCDTDGDEGLDEHTHIVDLPSGGGHSSRTLHFGPDKNLYVSAGSTCNVCTERDPRRAAMMRYNLDGSVPPDNPFVNDSDQRKQTVWAEGLRNSIDFLFMPDGQLWANHNGRDQMIDNQVKNNKPLEEAIIPVQGGKHHGWPFCTSEHPDGNPEPGAGPYVEVADPSSDVPSAPAGFSCDDAIPASYTVTAHSAPIGMTRYNGTTFPAAYQGDIFESLHGSWNRTPPAPCRVVRIHIENGKPVSDEDFLTGFQDTPNQACANGWGRPAGIVTGSDGALYVSDDLNGRVYRIVWSK